MNSDLNHLKTVLMIAFAIFVTSQSAVAVPKEGRTGASNDSVFRSGSPTVLDLDAGIMVGGGSTLPGVDVQIVSRLNTSMRLYAGGEVGLFIYSDPGFSGAVIPILATAFTEFDASRTVHPMFGMSLGPTLSTGGGYSSARFTVLFNPGMRFDIDRSVELNAQIRFGVIGSSFVVIPQAGLSFAI